MSAMTSIFVETGDGMVGCILILLAIYENVLAELFEIQNLCHFAVQDQRGSFSMYSSLTQPQLLWYFYFKHFKDK